VPLKTINYQLQLSSLEALCSAATKQPIGKILFTVPLAIDGNSVVLEQGKGTSLGTLAERKGGTQTIVSAQIETKLKTG